MHKTKAGNTPVQAPRLTDMLLLLLQWCLHDSWAINSGFLFLSIELPALCKSLEGSSYIAFQSSGQEWEGWLVVFRCAGNAEMYSFLDKWSSIPGAPTHHTPCALGTSAWGAIPRLIVLSSESLLFFFPVHFLGCFISWEQDGNFSLFKLSSVFSFCNFTENWEEDAEVSHLAFVSPHAQPPN